jgi:hypothetical protein
MSFLSRIQSLGLRSDLQLIDGEFSEGPDYLVVRSPKEPTYYWGNLLVFAGPPQDGDFETWEAHFAREFAAYPQVQHQTFTWDVDPESEGKPPGVQPFVDSKYEYEELVALTASSVRPPKHRNEDLIVRPLQGDEDWRDVMECQVASRDRQHSEASYREFILGRIRSYRARIAAGQGEWYGAFLEGKQVGSLGVFKFGELARYQIVTTVPERRRQGVCGTLVYESARRTLEDPEVTSLVMVADENYHAARIYESLGFEASEKMRGLCRWPRQARSTADAGA